MTKELTPEELAMLTPDEREQYEILVHKIQYLRGELPPDFSVVEISPADATDISKYQYLIPQLEEQKHLFERLAKSLAMLTESKDVLHETLDALNVFTKLRTMKTIDAIAALLKGA